MAEIIIYGTSAILGGCFMMYSYTSVRLNKEKKRTKDIKELQQKKYMEDEEKKRVFDAKKKQYDENIRIYKQYKTKENNNLSNFSEFSFI